MENKEKTIVVIDEKLCRGKKPNVDLIEGTWIAGGSIRRWFVGEEQDSDIDIYSKDEKTMNKLISKLELGTQLYETKNAKTFKRNRGILQFIKMYRNNPEECIKAFDYKHCMFAYDGKQIIADIEGIICALRKSLAINNVIKGYEVDTLRRAFKYQKQGYTICNGTLLSLAKTLSGLSVDAIKEQIEISPGGGKRIITYD